LVFFPSLSSQVSIRAAEIAEQLEKMCVSIHALKFQSQNCSSYFSVFRPAPSLLLFLDPTHVLESLEGQSTLPS
jgi:hypothetical protein